MERNYNREHEWNGSWVSSGGGTLTIGDLRDAIAAYPDEVELRPMVCNCGSAVKIFGFKRRDGYVQFLLGDHEHED